MTAFWAEFIRGLQQAWMGHYLPILVAMLLLAFVLAPVTRHALRFAAVMAVLFAALLVAGAVAAALGSGAQAGAFGQFAILVLGVALIRQVGLVLFRLVVPRLGMRPPRILEELLILFAYVVWVLLRLSAGGLDLGGLLASTAVLTAVLAFAMQDTLGNILSGLALQLDRSVHIGDWVQLDTISGRVIEVQWRHTAVRTLYGERVLIPNSQLMKSQITLTGGPSAPTRVRIVMFYCDFDMPSAQVIAAVNQALADLELPGVARSPAPSCVINDFVDGVVQYAVRYWLTDPESPGTTDSLIRQHVHTLFRRQGWRMAVPQRSVQLHRARKPAGASVPAADDSSQVFQGLSLFAALTPEERGHLAAQLKPAPYAAGSVIARQGQVGDCLYILVQGQVDVWLEDGSRRQALAVLEPVQVMGEMSLLTGEPRSATLAARSDVECWQLDKEAFRLLLQQRPQIADSFAQLLAERKAERSSVQERMQQASVPERPDAILHRIRGLFKL